MREQISKNQDFAPTEEILIRVIKNYFTSTTNPKDSIAEDIIKYFRKFSEQKPDDYGRIINILRTIPPRFDFFTTFLCYINRWNPDIYLDKTNSTTAHLSRKEKLLLQFTKITDEKINLLISNEVSIFELFKDNQLPKSIPSILALIKLCNKDKESAPEQKKYKPTVTFQPSPFPPSPFPPSPFQPSPFPPSPFQLSPFQLSPFPPSPFSPSYGQPTQPSPSQIHALEKPRSLLTVSEITAVQALLSLGTLPSNQHHHS